MAAINIPRNPSEFMKSISILHIALFAGQFMLAGIIFYLKGSYDLKLSSANNILFFIVPGIAIAGLYFGSKIYQQRNKKIPSESTLMDKLEVYRGAYILKLAMVEGPSILAIMAYYVTGNLLYLLIALFLMLYFFFLKPTLSTIENDVNFSSNEKDQMRKN